MYFLWRRGNDGMRGDQAKGLGALEQESARLTRLLADAELGKAILHGAAKGNIRARRIAGLRSWNSGARCSR
jgi:hypothetical protein